MEYLRGTTAFKKENTCVTLGKFDGLHLGHQLLLDHVTTLQDQGMTSVMFTFDYHPGNLFSEQEVRLIYTEEEKKFLLEKKGIQVMISYPFTRETANLEPEIFVKHILVEQLHAKAIVVGSDYRFGKQRSGDVELLQMLSKKFGYQLIVCEKRKYKGDIVSSTRIRELLKQGIMEKANELLGKPFFVRGEVIHGKAIGQTIGFPTANVLSGEQKLFPPNGVYATITEVEGKRFFGVTNIGCNPTVNGRVRDGKTFSVESHLFHCKQDLYGKIAMVEFYHYSRPEQCFSSLDVLKEQLFLDVEQAKDYFVL